MTDEIGTWYWHVHHEVLCEPLTEPLENRIAYIKANKPKREVKTRLRWFTPVRGKLPAKLIKTRDAYCKAEKTYDKTQDAFSRAWDAFSRVFEDGYTTWFKKTYVKARKAYDTAVDADVKAQDAYDKAGDAYYTAWDACKPELEALHATEHPGCPWDGKTLFPKASK